MTNGEKFKEVFGVSQVDEGVLYAFAWLPNHDAAEFSIDWWDAEYKEPTPKNDLGVDAISRDEVCRYVAEFVNHEFSTREEEELIDNIITGIEHMPSVTPQEPFINKPCVSSGVCEHDKQNVLDKIRTEIIERDKNIKSVRSDSCCFFTAEEVLEIIDKYKADIKPQEVRTKKCI